MKQKLIEVLETFGYPIFLQGSLNGQSAYPETFITYFVDDAPDNAHYDNEATSYAWDFSVILYGNDPLTVNTKADEIRKKLKDAGFIPQGKGRDYPSDVPSHTGWAMDFYIIEEVN